MDKQYQNMGIGAALLQDAIDRSMYAASIIGSKALVVDPINEKIKGFYAHFGFQQIKGSSKMFTSLIS
ncbi:MAG: GNAT family N-acetyltransferase [Eggerthellaceae bacterium]|nr:GNAT family N-acetyltransferase [Eggerthellaceae bacterium]